MSLNAALYQQLSTHVGLSALVGNRVYPRVSQQGSDLPYVTYQRITETTGYTHDRTEAVVSPDLFQFDVYGSSADQARTAADQLKVALNAWTTTSVNRAFIRSDQDLYEPDLKGIFRVSIDAEIWSTLTAPQQ